MEVTRRGTLTVSGAAVLGSAPATANAAPEVAVRETLDGRNVFDPNGLYVTAGTTVRFTFGRGTHTVTAYEDRIPEGAEAFDSGTRSEGVFEHTFDVPGTYDYFCRPHKSEQVGRIVVDEPGGPAEDSPIPDGEVPASADIVQEGSIPVRYIGPVEIGIGGIAVAGMLAIYYALTVRGDGE